MKLNGEKYFGDMNSSRYSQFYKSFKNNFGDRKFAGVLLSNYFQIDILSLF